jgi:hypothetical protein
MAEILQEYTGIRTERATTNFLLSSGDIYKERKSRPANARQPG